MTFIVVGPEQKWCEDVNTFWRANRKRGNIAGSYSSFWEMKDSCCLNECGNEWSSQKCDRIFKNDNQEMKSRYNVEKWDKKIVKKILEFDREWK